MTELNHTALRGILARILSVDEQFIVPKQGNWYNPQETDNAPDTWCAYVIRANTPLTVPFYVKSKDGKINSAATQKIATIDLQFVGGQAEENSPKRCILDITRRCSARICRRTRCAYVQRNAGAKFPVFSRWIEYRYRVECFYPRFVVPRHGHCTGQNAPVFCRREYPQFLK